MILPKGGGQVNQRKVEVKEITSTIDAASWMMCIQIPESRFALTTGSPIHVFSTLAKLSWGHLVTTSKFSNDTARMTITLFTQWIVVRVRLAAFTVLANKVWLAIALKYKGYIMVVLRHLSVVVARQAFGPFFDTSTRKTLRKAIVS